MEHGHTNVPCQYEPNLALGRWAAQQRKHCKCFELNNEDSILSAERYQMLCSIGIRAHRKPLTESPLGALQVSDSSSPAEDWDDSSTLASFLST